MVRPQRDDVVLETDQIAEHTIRTNPVHDLARPHIDRYELRRRRRQVIQISSEKPATARHFSFIGIQERWLLPRRGSVAQVAGHHPVLADLHSLTFVDASHEQHYGQIALPGKRLPARLPTRFPAVVSHEFGHGQVVAFTYNLPESMVYTRQGNPGWANQERDGIIGIRAADMFLGWIDPALTHLNQADEQMHLLSNTIEGMCAIQKPLPRLWYFPGYSQCLILLTDDGEDSTENDFEDHFKDIESKGALMTLYLKDTSVLPESVSRWVAKGHEIASHFDDTAEAEHPTEECMQDVC